MEDLREKVYECTLPVEAHMICDLLSRAGISARVDGEFLAGAGGDLPLGNAVKVRVEPDRAADARAVIAEWERSQPPPEPTPAIKRSAFRSPLWFAAGALAGGVVVAFALRSPYSQDGVDYDGDGNAEYRYHYAGRTPTLTEIDRDSDGKTDARWSFDARGYEDEYSLDEDFDGRFEVTGIPERGSPGVEQRDADGDGRPEQTRRYTNGVLSTVAHHDETGRIVKREHMVAGQLASADFDADGDGTFERHVDYDRFGEPRRPRVNTFP